MRLETKWLSGIAAILSFLFIISCNPTNNEDISFNQNIRPILNEKCLSCHGGVKKLGGYSLLFPEEAFDTTDSGIHGIVAGKPEESQLYLRLITDDPELRMPFEHPALNKEEIKLIKRWIEEGATWETHWAFIPPAKDINPPKQSSSDWPLNSIDQFILRKLQENELDPAPEAGPEILLRRLYLDLTGLPPSRSEVQTFVESPNREAAYDKAIDQLLDSPHFGEHWASMWLDLARYGDSQGYQKDPIRKTIWRYRDWVIDAFNRDMPFDQFTIEQLAGDLLPARTDHQLLATAFHRNTNTNDEGGTDDEEFRVVAVLDRLNTTFEVWQGLTMSCVQCHSHPYDPIRHEEFYESMAFFNNTMDADLRSEAPLATVLSPGQQFQLDTLKQFLDKYQNTGDTLSNIYRQAVANISTIQPGAVPVMQDFPPDTMRQSHVFVRGNWLDRGELVAPAVPESLNLSQQPVTEDRLGLANWLVSADNPLTARVIVNRFWAAIFGHGLVETVEDFGTQGAAPTHPELLDWLAVRFMQEHQWSVKSLLKDIVQSASYRQSAVVDAQKLDKDPYNQLLSRGPRFRLSAEQVRDQALAVSGLLSKKMFGPSVMPYQPEGVWNTIRHVARWQTSPGEDQYRRAVYTFLRKTSPYPAFLTFDSPSREVCVSRRTRTNTPLQAMVTLNDPVYLEAATALAQKMAKVHEASEQQIQFGYECAVLRAPKPDKLATLIGFYEQARQKYEAEPEEIALLVEDPEKHDPAFAALVNVANVILNLDEVLNK